MARALRVLFVGHQFRISGRTNYTIGLARGLAAAKHQVGVVAAGGPQLAALREAGIRVWELPGLGSAWRAPFASRSALREIHGFKADLVHIQSCEALGMGLRVARMLGHRPVVVTAHRDYVRGLRPVGHGIAAVIALSEPLRENLVNEAGVPKERVHVIPNGIDVDAFEAPFPDSSGRRPNVCGMGRLDRRRGFEHLVHAAAQVLASGQSAQFIIMGGGPERRALVELASRLGIREHVVFPGVIGDPRAALAAADVFVNPALEEALGLPVLEAMATGRPVITSGVGGAFHLVEDGVNGFVVPRADPGAIADRLGRLLADADLRREMGRRGNEIARERFGIRTVVALTIELYRRVGRESAETQAIENAIAAGAKRPEPS